MGFSFRLMFSMMGTISTEDNLNFLENSSDTTYSKTCVRQPPLKLTLVVDVKKWLSYKGTCHVILLAKLHGMYHYKTDNFFHINRYLKSVSKVALLHRFYCTCLKKIVGLYHFIMQIYVVCIH